MQTYVKAFQDEGYDWLPQLVQTSPERIDNLGKELGLKVGWRSTTRFKELHLGVFSLFPWWRCFRICNSVACLHHTPMVAFNGTCIFAERAYPAPTGGAVGMPIADPV